MNKYQLQILKRGTRMSQDIELLSAILSEGVRGNALDEVESLAGTLLLRAGGNIFNLSRFSLEDLRNYGLSDRQALLLATSLEFSRRFEDRTESTNALRLTEPKKVFEYFKNKTRDLDYEKCWIVSLNSKNCLIRCDEITSGVANCANFHPRDFLRAAVRANAISIIMVHNHPSGDPIPSAEDVEITRKLQAAARTLDINFVDHIIIGRENIPPHFCGFYSFHESRKI